MGREGSGEIGGSISLGVGASWLILAIAKASSRGKGGGMGMARRQSRALSPSVPYFPRLAVP